MSSKWKFFLFGILSAILLVNISGAHALSPTEPVWNTYQSKQFGYSIKYPNGWKLDDSNFAKKQEIRVTEGTNASLKINAYFDKGMTTVDKVKQALKLFEKRIRGENGLKVITFKTNTSGKLGGFIALGKQTISNQSYYFENYGLLATSGRILVFHAVAKEKLFKEYLSTLRAIRTSFTLDKN